MMRNTTPVPLAVKLFLVILLACVALQAGGGIGRAAPAVPQAGPSQLPLLCSYNVSQRYCDLRVVLLIDDTGSMRSNDPAFMRDQAAKNLVDILFQEYYQPALDAQALDPSVTLPDIEVAVIHFSHCVSNNPSDNCGQDAKFNSGWLPITRRESLYSAIDWLKTQPNFYRVKQYTHFAEPLQAATDLFDQPAARAVNDCVRRAVLLLTDGTPEEAAGPLNEPELGNEMGRAKNIVKGYLSEAGSSLYVTAFKIIPRYWQAAEPYWKDIAGPSNVSLESSLDGVASRMEKIAASEIGAQSSTLSPDPKDARLYRLQLLHHVASLRITYYKLDPNATLTLTDPAGNQVIPDGTTVTQTGKGTAIEVWTLNEPAPGIYQVKTSAKGGTLTTIPLYALSLQLDAPSPAGPLLQFTDGEIRFKLLDSTNGPVLPTDDPPFNLSVQASLINQAGGSRPLALTQIGEGYRAAWMPLTAEKVLLHVSAELTDASHNSLWKCEGDGSDLPVDPLAVRAELPSTCTPTDTSLVIPLQLTDGLTGRNATIDLPIQWQASSVTVPDGQPVDTSVDEVDAKAGAYRLTINPVIPEDVRAHVSASVIAGGEAIRFYDEDLTATVCPSQPPPPPPSCSGCSGYGNYLLWLLLILLIALLVTRLTLRKRGRKYLSAFWLLIVLLILLILVWLLRCCNIPFWPLLVLILILLVILLLIWVISREAERESSYQFWLLIVLLILLALVWLVFFSGYWIYLVLMLLIVLLILSLVAWLLYCYSNPLWGVISIVDRRDRTLWSARLAGPGRSGGRSYYDWKFKDPICTVKQIRLRSWDQPDGWLVLTVTTTGGKRIFERTLEEWRDCDLGAGCRIAWQEKARPSGRPEPRKPTRPKSGGGRKARSTRYAIEEIEGIGRIYAERLKRSGIHSTDDLLKAAGSRKGRRALAEKTGLSILRILEWVNRADLMRVPGVGGEYSDLLEAGGVDTVKELRQRNPENLWGALRRANARKHLVRRVPTLEEVQAWVASAGKMKAMVKY